MLVGYARVSTLEQETDLQLDALRRAGVRKIYSEKTGGVSARPELQRLLASLRSGDHLVVYKLDRLARSLADLLGIIERLSRASCGFRSLTEPIDTATPAGMLMLQMLGAVAQFERSLIRERSMAGQCAAKARGKHCGRPRALLPATEADIVRLYASGYYTLDSLAAVFEVHPSTVKRAVYRITKPGHSSLK
ncbi:MAG: recombinase family protein [Rhodoferax sp.]|nr:recombinase family protein [Rhodoferax sp.]